MQLQMGLLNSEYEQPPTKHDQSQAKDIHAHTLHVFFFHIDTESLKGHETTFMLN